MKPRVALLDANVLYSAPLRDILVQLSYAGLYQARWSAEINNEWKRNLLAARPELAERLARTQATMLRAVPDALVTGYEHLIPKLLLPDSGDRHVLAAAVTTSAEAIVTFNLRDFPSAALEPYGMVAQHPDDFLQSLIAIMPLEVLSGVRECVGRLTQPALSVTDYLAILNRLGLTKTASFLAANLASWQP